MTIHSVVIQKLLSTNAHLGRRTAEHHFKIYTYGIRNDTAIIDSDKTLICMRNACDFIGNLVRQKARFIFVNTNPLYDEIIDQMTKKIGCRNDRSWRLGGFLTNSLSPRKFRSRNKKLNLAPIHPPDCVVILDAVMKSSVILEAEKLQIPIVGLVDSSIPLETYKRITYPVPANDSVQFVYLFCNLITKTFLYEQKKLAALKGIEANPKEIGSAIEVCNGLTCLDLLANHIEAVNSNYGCNIPLLLMNAVNTHDVTLKVLEKHLNKNIHTFVQSPDHAMPLQFEDEDEEEEEEPSYSSNFNQVLLSLKSSGKLEVLLSQGKEYILLLDSDNLADVLDPKILNHLIHNDIGYCMEVTPASSKLEDDAVNPHEAKTQSEEKSKLIETANLWLNIKAIDALVKRVFLKENSPVSEFSDSGIALNVPQSRSLPLKATSDLLLLQSDLYTCSEGILIRNGARTNPSNPSIELGPEFEKVIDFKKRFKSIPSIIELDSLKVTGNVWFGSGVTLKGRVSITAMPHVQIVIPDGAVLENKEINSNLDI